MHLCLWCGGQDSLLCGPSAQYVSHLHRMLTHHGTKWQECDHWQEQCSQSLHFMQSMTEFTSQAWPMWARRQIVYNRQHCCTCVHPHIDQMACESSGTPSFASILLLLPWKLLFWFWVTAAPREWQYIAQCQVLGCKAQCFGDELQFLLRHLHFINPAVSWCTIKRQRKCILIMDKGFSPFLQLCAHFEPPCCACAQCSEDAIHQLSCFPWPYLDQVST